MGLNVILRFCHFSDVAKHTVASSYWKESSLLTVLFQCIYVPFSVRNCAEFRIQISKVISVCSFSCSTLLPEGETQSFGYPHL